MYLVFVYSYDVEDLEITHLGLIPGDCEQDQDSCIQKSHAVAHGRHKW
jgi:hypothetical protein